MYDIPVWQMIQEAINAKGEGTFTLDDIRRYILKRYPQVNESTVSTQVNYCCVNRPSRTNTPANQEPRIANGHYDILFAESRNCYAKYDPQKHGVWDIAQISGKFVVRNVTGATTNHETEQVKQPQKSKTRQIGNRVLTGLMPSARSVSEYADKWCALDNYPAQESALHKLFHECFPTNTDLDGVLVKVATLNAFYATNIYNVFAVARHIVAVDFDARLQRGDDTLVSDIATGHGVCNSVSGKESRFYSFASKYCSHHRPDVYPIYDSYVEKMLLALRDRDGFAQFTREELHDYRTFKRVIVALQTFYALESCSLKAIDQYLWLVGKEAFPKAY